MNRALLSAFFFAFLLILFSACKKDVTINQVPAVTAGNSISITLPVDSALISGSAKDKDGSVVGYLWSQVSGPGASVIINPGDSSTWVKELVAGTYEFQLMAVDNQGATGISANIIVTVLPSVIHTLTLQPANNPLELHLFGNNSGLDASDPSAPDLGAAAWTSNSAPVYMRGILSFDLSSIPSGATITSARLTLYSNPTPLNGNLVDANYGVDNSMLIQQITSTWTAASTKWSTQPGTITQNELIIPSTASSVLDLADLDVLPIVKNMQAGNNAYGFLIKLQNEVIYNSRIFCSSKYSDATKHPKLVITYTE